MTRCRLELTSTELVRTPLQGAYAYKIYGRISGALGLLKTVNWNDVITYKYNTFPPYWEDDGSVTPAAAPPIINTTGNVLIEGTLENDGRTI